MTETACLNETYWVIDNNLRGNTKGMSHDKCNEPRKLINTIKVGYTVIQFCPVCYKMCVFTFNKP